MTSAARAAFLCIRLHSTKYFGFWHAVSALLFDLLHASGRVCLHMIVLPCPAEYTAKIAKPVVGLGRVSRHGLLAGLLRWASLSDDIHQSAEHTWREAINYGIAKCGSVF
ncbi:hypothetical protein AO826_20560 [Xanthomonas phaseoli pv. manihotis]|nr:hypothetical protein AO826_20560 [Xanthomonas phaseoli pv. manihotis]